MYAESAPPYFGPAKPDLRDAYFVALAGLMEAGRQPEPPRVGYHQAAVTVGESSFVRL